MHLFPIQVLEIISNFLRRRYTSCYFNVSLRFKLFNIMFELSNLLSYLINNIYRDNQFHVILKIGYFTFYHVNVMKFPANAQTSPSALRRVVPIGVQQTHRHLCQCHSIDHLSLEACQCY